MVKMKAAKTLGLIFGILCAVALVLCLCFAVTLPSKSTYVTFYGTVTRFSPGYFDLDYLSSVILLSMGTFLGFSVFGSIRVEKAKKEKKVEMTEEVSSSEEVIPEPEETEENKD
ncbi:MAG: hypothetical protein KBS81_07020 [Spirochaetales bacterium]|nr:hypothetical protein [Candidatus Physcosoma equi]